MRYRIFKARFEKTGIDPNNSLFIDDDVVNIEAALRCKMLGIIYQNCNSLKQELIK